MVLTEVKQTVFSIEVTRQRHVGNRCVYLLVECTQLEELVSNIMMSHLTGMSHPDMT